MKVLLEMENCDFGRLNMDKEMFSLRKKYDTWDSIPLANRGNLSDVNGC